MRLVRRPLASSVAAALTAVLATALLPASPAAAANVRVDRRLFGLHDSNAVDGSWPAISPGSIRLWDSGVQWLDLEPQENVYDWTKLDRIVNEAARHGTEVTLVLGQTPGWADDPALLGSGPQYMPRLDAWTSYVTNVVTRYKGRIGAYQVWNEANIVNYWAQNAHNTPARMAQLTSSAYGIIKSIDSSALVVGPAFATRLSWQRTYLRTFYNQRVGGVPIWKKMDAISLNLYPLSTGTPESSMKLLSAVRVDLALLGVPRSKPIWNSEINYGLATGGSGSSSGISQVKQASYVIRTYLLNAAQGVRRVHWYMWDRPSIGNTKMVSSDGSTPTLAGKAFGIAGGWMRGGTLLSATRSTQPCARDRVGTYVCVIRYSGGFKRVYWNPSKTVKVRTAKSATFTVGIYGVRKAIKGGVLLKVGSQPIMVRSKR